MLSNAERSRKYHESWSETRDPLDAYDASDDMHNCLLCDKPISTATYDYERFQRERRYGYFTISLLRLYIPAGRESLFRHSQFGYVGW